MRTDHTTRRAAGARRRARVTPLALGTVVLLAGCGHVLDVETPDIIQPGVIKSPAGADAVRAGALVQLSKATGGDDQVDPILSFIDSIVMLGGLLADEFRSGDTFIQRDETDRRAVETSNANVEYAYRALERARVSAQLGIEALQTYDPQGDKWKTAEMLWVQGYIETVEAEHFCGALPTSEAKLDGTVTYGQTLTTQAMLQRAVQHLDQALQTLGTATGDEEDRLRNSILVTRGRALLDLGQFAQAAAAVSGVPTAFARYAEFNSTLIYNQNWEYNNNERRYTVSAGEGGAGINFATAKDPRLPVCRGGDAVCNASDVGGTRIFDTQNSGVLPLYVQLRFPTRDTPWPYANGVEARLIEAEAQLAAGASPVPILNALRADAAGTGVSGLTPLADPGTAA